MRAHEKKVDEAELDLDIWPRLFLPAVACRFTLSFNLHQILLTFNTFQRKHPSVKAYNLTYQICLYFIEENNNTGYSSVFD